MLEIVEKIELITLDTVATIEFQMLETTDMTVFIAVVTAFTMLFHASETNCTIGARNAVTDATI